MALEIKGLKRVFKLKKNGETLRLDDPNPEMAVNDVMDFYSMTYPELTTATPHGPVMEDDCAVYEFKTTIGTKDESMKADNKNKGKKVCRLLQDYETERLARLIIEDIMSATDISRGTRRRRRRLLPPQGSVMVF